MTTQPGTVRTDAADPIRCDDALARPVRMVGPGESGGVIYEVVTAILTDLPYRHGIERVAPSALADDLDAWVGRPVVFAGAEHDAATLDRDPTIQGREARGTVLSARYDAEAGERIMRTVIHDPADCALVDAGRFAAASEAYDPTLREPTEEERAAGVTAVQIARRPSSLAFVPAGRAGPRARVRTDLHDPGDPMRTDAAAFSLDGLQVILDTIPTDNAAALALLKAAVVRLGGEAEEPTAPVATVSTDAMVPAAQLAAEKARADGLQARLDGIEKAARKSRYTALKTRADVLEVHAEAVEDPTDAQITALAERIALDDGVRTDAADPYRRGEHAPPPRPGRTDGADTTTPGGAKRPLMN